MHTDRIELFRKIAGISNYGYGLGWMQGDWNEHEVSWHSGGYPGYVSYHALVREQNLGIVIMMSQQSQSIELILNYLLGYHLLGVHTSETLQQLETEISYRNKRYAHDQDSLLSLVKKDGLDQVMLDDYVGAFFHDDFNRVEVRIHEGRLLIQLGNLLFFGDYIGDDQFLIRSEVDDTMEVIDFYHVRSNTQQPYIDLFGKKFTKGQNK